MRSRRCQTASLVLALVLASHCGSSPTSPNAPITYAALGASDAVGFGASPLTAGYVYLLSQRLNGSRADASLHNFGILGALADQIASQELDQAIAVNPGVITLWTRSRFLSIAS
jgi:hypothetical protein